MQEGKIVNLAGEQVETEEGRKRKRLEQFEAERKEFMTKWMPHLSMAIDEVCHIQGRCNVLGMYDTHRILSRMGVRLSWLRGGIAQAMKNEADLLLAGAGGFVVWSDGLVIENISTSGLMEIHHLLDRLAMNLIRLSENQMVRGDVALSVARVEEAKEVSLIEFQELTEGKLLVKLNKSVKDGKKESDVPEIGSK